MPRTSGAVVVAWLLVLLASTTSAQVWDRYLNGGHGPYRGRVVDAETGTPLAGAVVVANWRREEVQLGLHLRTVRYAIREVVTDANGEFVLSAEDVERTAPPKTLRPHFVIFYPGYGSFPNDQVAPQGFLGGIFEGAGTTVELPRLKNREERLDRLSWVSPYSLSDEPFKEIPNFIRLVNNERVSLGLKPYPPPENRQ